MAATGTRWWWGRMATMGQDGCQGVKMAVGQMAVGQDDCLGGKMADKGARWGEGARWLPSGQDGGGARWPLWGKMAAKGARWWGGKMAATGTR